jgi:hypothetical protein
LLGLVIVFAVLLVVIAVLSQTRMARDFLREQTVSYLNNSYRGSFSLGGVDGSILWGITLHDLVVRSQNAEMLRVSRISVGYSIAELLRATKFSRIEIDRAVGHLAPEPNQELNLMAAMAPKHPQPQLKTPSKTRLTIQNLVIRDSKIELIQAGKSYRIEPVFIGVYLNLDGPAIDALLFERRRPEFRTWPPTARSPTEPGDLRPCSISRRSRSRLWRRRLAFSARSMI